MKKRHYIMVIILVFVIIFGVIALIEYRKTERSRQVIFESSHVFWDGDITGGFEECEKAPYFKEVCYGIALSYKESHNETITKEFCDSFPVTPVTAPFWMIGKNRDFSNYAYGRAVGRCYALAER